MRSDSEPSPGAPRWLGRYEILRRLGVGGMAEVFLGRVTGAHGFERLVAIKRLLATATAQADAARLLLNEARVGGALAHANIVQVHEVAEEGGELFIVMEHVEGLDARALIARAQATGTTLPLDVALTIADDVCAALAYAHACVDTQGAPLHVLHCDVTPSNVLVSREGVAKLGDFGIARARATNVETRQTSARGKVGYMSPEQCRGAPLDTRSDIYSLCVTIAELVTGRAVFSETSDYELLKRVIEGPPPSLDLPAPLAAILQRGLVGNRDQRWGSVVELRQALEGYAEQHAVGRSRLRVAETIRRLVGDDAPTAPVPAPGRPRRRRWVVAAGLVAAAAVAGGAWGFLRDDVPEPRVAAATTTAPAPVALAPDAAPAVVQVAPPPPDAASPATVVETPPRATAQAERAPTPRPTRRKRIAPSESRRKVAPVTKPWDPDALRPPR